ncbi:hypothetical protein AAD001_10430 [Colwelliaceae bacterium 6471]
MSDALKNLDKNTFKSVEQSSKNAFNQQKALIKQLLLGRTVNCSTCGQPLSLVPPNDTGRAVIKCQKGCTDILLDLA